jgi:predicted nucleotidyltransferase
MGEILEYRRDRTQSRLKEFRSRLVETEELTRDKACVYLTGSFGRGEAGDGSDLDLFIACGCTQEKPDLRRLDEICVKAALIQTARDLKFPEFSGDGEYLKNYTFNDLISNLGKPEDDISNTLTARLLLLLESRSLFGEEIYRQGIRDTLAAYWRDYEDHKDSFSPAFLANDILRLWRTFCVNYEARTVTEPVEKKAKRKLKNYKLKHSRLLTCYSGLLFLLAVFGEKGTVNPDDAVKMVELTPTERLEWLIRNHSCSNSRPKVELLLQHYENFLKNTETSESELISRFLDKKSANDLMREAYEFGDRMWDVLESIGSESSSGKESRFFRLLVV